MCLLDGQVCQLFDARKVNANPHMLEKMKKATDIAKLQFGTEREHRVWSTYEIENVGNGESTAIIHAHQRRPIS